MGHKYIKTTDVFSTIENGAVPKPTPQEVADDRVLRADGTWVAQSGGGGGGGASIIYGTTDPVSGQGSNGDLYVKYIVGKALAGIWGKVSGAWLPLNLFATYEWDFTKSLNAINNGTAIGITNATRNSNGLIFDSANDKASIPTNLLDYGNTYEITIASMSISSTGSNNRLFTFKSDNSCGLVWRGATGKWGTYDSSNGWQESTITTANYFDNSVLKIVITDDHKWHIYKDDVLVFEPSNAITLDTGGFALGASSNGCYNMTITGLKIYPNAA